MFCLTDTTTASYHMKLTITFLGISDTFVGAVYAKDDEKGCRRKGKGKGTRT
jgi:hypothetical protein